MKKDEAKTSARKSTKRKVPFQKAGAGIEAHGHVSEIREHHDGESVRMSVKHGKPKAKGDGIFDTYPDESSFTMPAAAAAQFKYGQRVRVRVHPHGDGIDAPPAATRGKRRRDK